MAVDDVDETVREEEEEGTGVREQTALPNAGGLSFTVGGTILKEALCLLDGIQEDAGNMRVILPIKRLPATLGRTHENTDKNFVSLGSARAVSRQHVRIDYRVPTSGGGCGHIQSKVGFRAEFFYNADDPVTTTEIVIPDASQKLSETGFYCITCLGKNRVLVDGKRIEQGQTALLQSGSAIRIASFALYFFAPATPSAKTLLIRDDVAPVAKRRKLTLGVSSAVPAVAGSGTGEGIAPGATKQTLQAEIEDLSTPVLLMQMKVAVDENVWDRRHQLIGSTISYRAVLAAAKDPALAKVAERADGQLSRSEIMDWIAASSRFKTWVDHMCSKMEAKSYQANITKALIKAGFKRTASQGRYIKWHLPESLYPPGGSPGGAETDDGEDRKDEHAFDKSEQSNSDGKDGDKKIGDKKKQDDDSNDGVDDLSGDDNNKAAKDPSQPGKPLANDEKPAADDDSDVDSS